MHTPLTNLNYTKKGKFMRFTKVLFLLLVLTAISLSSNAQDSKFAPPVLNDVNPSSYIGVSTTSKQVVQANNLDAVGDLLRNHNVDSVTPGNAVSYGVVWTGSYYIVSQFNANKFYKISAAWVKLDSFAITGGTGSFRDMAFAKGLLWGVNTTGQIFGVDTGTKAVVKTITTSLTTLRAICWDPVRSGFWVGTNSFTGPLRFVDTLGAASLSITTPASGLYSVGYDDNPAGPYLWIGTDQTPTSNTGTALVQYNATTLVQIGTPLNLTIPLTTGAPLASGGGEVVTNLVPGKRTWVGLVQGTPDRVFVVDLGNSSTPPLSAFNLQTPTAGARVVTAPGSSTPVTITWDTSATGASYKWIFGSPTTATRRLTLPSGTNSITTTLGALDAILAANGFTNNGTASDSAVGQWDVWAFKGPGAPGADSLKSTNGPRAITLRRQQVALTPFALTAPASGTRIITSPIDPSPISITWGASGSGATYRWLFKVGASYTDPATVRILSDGAGFTNSLTIRNSQADSLLASLGVAPGDSAVGFWRVRAYSTTDSLNSTAPDRSITLRRAGLLPLLQTFSDAAMPPPFWTYTGTGTQYWTRQTPGGYGASVGSAMFDYYSASGGTTQSLTSNQFPAVTGPNNYLRFNYAHKFYQPTTTLSADSMAIYTSTNAGATWNRLITLIATSTPALGYNSTTNMSTTGAIGNNTEYMAPANNEWATKLFVMPVGTNMVRFTALSAFGNNLFIDDITSGPSTGTGTPLTLIPEKFELKQNYPNPFNPTTKISFSLPKSAFVSLKVYDMLGKEVAQLVNQELTPNNYSFDFNAANLSSGVYFYKLESAEFSDVKRMMLIK